MGFMLPPFFSAIGNFIVTHWAKIKTAAYLLTLAVGVKGFMQAKEMMGRGQDIMANKTAAGGKIPVIYGTRRVGCQVVYMDVSNNDSRDLYVVYALSVGECDEILGRTIELDGSKLTDGSRFRDGGYIGTDKISSGNGSLNTVSQNGTGIDAGAGQFGTSPTAKYRYVFNLHHGAATQAADPMLVASMPNWTSAHKLNGVAYIACHFGYDKEGMWQGVPQMTVQVRGKKVFDPRDSSQTFGTVSTYKYSDNPALCFLDLISNNQYGKGLTAAQLNMSTFTSAANVCDTEVDQPYFNGSAKPLTWSGNAGDNFITIGGTSATTTWWQNKVGELIDIYDTNGNGVIDGKEIVAINRDNFYDANEELIVYINDTLSSTYSSQTGTSLVKVKRFHCNGYLRTDKNVMENARELLANMRGIFLYINGQYELSIEDTGSSTFSINDSHIISDSGITVDYGNKDKKANKVIVEFFNANKKYELDTATVLHDANPEYYSDDGDEILEVKAEFPFITDPYIAYNMAKTILTRSRNQTTMQFVGTPEMYKLNIADIVTLTYAGLGFNGKVCRVEALELMPDGLVQVSLIEYFDVYTWEVPPQEPVEELSNLPSAYAVKAPTGLSFTDSNASSTDRPFISWNIPTDFPDAQYRVNVKDSSNNQVLNKIVNVNNADLNFLPTGTNYVASITSLNTLGTESSAATLTFTVGDAPVGLGDVQADVITANEINVTSLSAISADLGSITAGNMNIGSGNFTVSTAGLMTATGATISGGITATSLNVTNATITGTLDASVITLNSEPLSDVLTYSEAGGIGLLTLNEGAAIDGDFVVDGNFEATGSQPDLVIGKVYNVSVINDRTISADARLVSQGGIGSFKIQSQTHNSSTLTTKLSLSYDAIGKASLSSDNTLKFYTSGSLALTLDTSQNATFTGEVTADALGLPSQTPSTTTNKLYNVGGSLYFNGSAVGGGGTGDITAVTAGTNLNGGGTSGAVTLNLDSALTGLTSIALSGNMTVTGTVDGRDISSDGSKLDGIESGATADQTQAQINALGITATGLSGSPNITVGTLTSSGNITGTLATAAQPNITSVGTLAGLTGGTGDLNWDSGTLFVDSSANKVGIGTENPRRQMHIHNSASATVGLQMTNGNTGESNDSQGFQFKVASDGHAEISQMENSDLRIFTNATEAMRINSSQNLLLGTTDTTLYSATSGGGIYAVPNGSTTIARQSTGSTQPLLILNETGVDGTLQEFRKDGSTVGSIGTRDTGALEIGSGDVYLQFNGANDWIKPVDGSGNNKSGVDLGTSGARFDNLYLSGAITSAGVVKGNGYYPANTTSSVGYYGYNNTNMVLGVNGAAYYYGSDGGTYGIVIQGGHPICKSVKIGSVNAGVTVIDASRNFSGQSYSGASNSANFAANTVTSYATWKTSGSKGGYDGIVFDSGGDVAVMFDSDGNGGFYRQANSRWYQYHLVGNNCTGFGASTTSSAYQIYVTGAIYSTDNITAYSDRRIKENIVTIDKPLAKVEGLRGVYYNKIDDIDKTKQIGFIAQEVDEVVPELVTYAEDVDQYGVNYGNATALLVEAIKELSQQVKDQQKQIDQLKQRLDNDSSN